MKTRSQKRTARNVDAKTLAALLKRGAMRREGRHERMTVYLPSEVATDLRVYCARQRRSISDAITAAVELVLAIEPPLPSVRKATPSTEP